MAVPHLTGLLMVPGSDLRIVAYTAAPGSEAAGRLRLLGAIGTQDLQALPSR